MRDTINHDIDREGAVHWLERAVHQRLIEIQCQALLAAHTNTTVCNKKV